LISDVGANALSSVQCFNTAGLVTTKALVCKNVLRLNSSVGNLAKPGVIVDKWLPNAAATHIQLPGLYSTTYSFTAFLPCKVWIKKQGSYNA